MPVNQNKTWEDFDGNGSTQTAYPISLERDSDDHLNLLVGSIPFTNFTIAANELRTNVPIAPGTEIILYRETPPFQINPYPINTTPQPEDVRQNVDALTFMIQEILDRDGRAGIGITGSLAGFVSYLVEQNQTLENRARAVRNICGWHFAGNLNGESANFLAEANACGPFKTGQIWAVEVETVEEPQFPPPLPGPDGIPGTPDDIPGEFGPDGIPGTPDDVEPVFDQPVAITDGDNKIRLLAETRFYVFLADSEEWRWTNTLELETGSTTTPPVGPLTAPPHSYGKPWNVDPQGEDCGCAQHGGAP